MKNLLVAACRGAWQDDAEIDWDQFAHLARQHGVLRLVRKNFAGKALPEPLCETVDEAVWSSFQQLQLGTIIAALKAAGIRSLAYKGPALAALLYGDAGARSSIDLDILIEKDDLMASLEVLQALGFVPEVPRPRPEVFARFAYEYSLYHPQTGISLELHWRLVPLRLGLPLTVNSMFPNHQEVRVLKFSVATFPSEELLLALCVHGSKHCWSRLIWICDVAVLLERVRLDWARVDRLARETGTHLYLQLGMVLASDVFQAKLPRPLVAAPLVVRIAQWERSRLFEGPPSGTETKLTQFLLAPTWIARARYVCHVVLYPTETDLTWVILPPRWSILYFLLRPLSYPATVIAQARKQQGTPEGPSKPPA